MKSPIFIAITVCVIVVIGWFALQQQNISSVPPAEIQVATTTSATTTEVVTQTPTYEMFIKGVTFTKDPYHIFVAQEGEDNTYADFTYTKQGVIPSGQFAGYSQLIVTRTYDGPSMMGPGVFAFITKDFKTFLVAKQYALENESYERFNKDVVIGLADFTISHPAKLTYQGVTYNRQEIFQKGEYVFGSKGARLFTIGELAAYAENIAYQDKSIMRYLLGTSRLLVQDGYGVIFAYVLDMNDEDGTVFTSADFVNVKSGYASYGDLIPAACGMPIGNKVLTNIVETDIEKFTTTTKGIEIFRLKDINHPLYRAQYDRKVGEQKDYFLSVNPGLPKVPTYEEYVSKNPILLYKDVWGRWNAVGEFEYKLDGGCGKPVIYLYPEKATNVSISFAESVKLTTDIPTYSGGWNVTAYPDGTLVDLQREKTDCAAIYTDKVGSEYAADACRLGVYPYIYWAGDVDAAYPKVKDGFVVAKSDLKKTLEEKLTTIGLSAKETRDMMEYWYPYLLKKDFAYYRLTFLQNKEMNSFIPMNVSPRPDTVLRVFLDWEGLDQAKVIHPQVLQHIERKGFTLVEWGGLKK